MSGKSGFWEFKSPLNRISMGPEAQPPGRFIIVTQIADLFDELILSPGFKWSRNEAGDDCFTAFSDRNISPQL